MSRGHERQAQRQHRHAASQVGRFDGETVEATVTGSLRSSLAAVASPGARAVPAASVSRAQQAVGNVGIQRLLSVQRWPLGLPALASCDDVLGRIAARSPYRPEAAFTDAKFRYKPEISVTAEGGKHTATVASANVDADISVDMPEWSPEGAMARPWAKAVRALRDHEGKHEDVAERTKGRLRTELESVSATRTSASEAKAAAEGAAKAKWAELLAAYRREQRALDPYVVELDCP